ncbi:similarity to HYPOTHETICAL PROTEIN C215_HUMAN [Encephalitozoon cuniculi GB-M1]|uniref:Uncharacterized protein n=1 Tax=Encephalitozoon cuniculi (strain GB-M1) TaxID=284813 RepID=Q8SUW6_ENCCU|nr:uncharacterized protein ECU07_1440 [Encephalitozoon cuniculi GB-M1]CAD25676.1 similarity to HYPOTHETICAL PROTEIN C215_HUMAN [Encephalitozoon cuniculi GB-M1]
MDENREKYEAEMTKKLDAFKTAKEWSDFISLLSSLDSTIKKFSVPEIPKKKLLFKRLNQCLNPVLPAGIHNKTLETYSLIFERISRESLLKDFNFLTLGLFTFSAHCRILVVSSFLDLIERYIVPLGKDVESYCTSILIGLLPPMEFESGEYYSRAHLIITEFKSLISPDVFYSSMWGILLNDERLRTSVVNSMMSMGWSESILTHARLMVRALCAGLGSESTLVVRNCLDLLIFVFPDKSHVDSADMLDDLIEAVIKLFVKRDLSLNKRIYGWMCMADSFDEVNVVLLSRALKRFLDRGSAEDIQLFFRIMMTLQDKGKLCEKIMESLLFDILECLKRHERDYIEEYAPPDAFEERSSESIDVEKIARAFLTTDLDSVWKIFYLQLKSVLSHSKEKMLLDMDLTDDEEFNDSMVREEMYSMHTMSLILNEGQMTSSECLALGASSGEVYKGAYEMEESSLLEEMELKKKGIAGRVVENRESKWIKDANNPNQVLGFIRFAVDNYSVVDSEVYHYHLPFLVHLVLSDFLLFEPQVLFSFLDFSTKLMRFRERQLEGGKNLQKLIGKFYLEEDTSVLDEISSTILYSISDKIGKVIESNVALSLPLMSTFIKIHGVDVFPSGFIQSYHCLVLKSSSKLMKEHLEVYKIIDCTQLDPLGMFEVLWGRFCHTERSLYLERSRELDGGGVHRSPRAGTREMIGRSSTNKLSGIGRVPNRKVLTELLWRYNMIFRGSFEKLLLKRMGEVEEISYFLLLKLENFRGNFDFLELYYVLNCKLDPDDPVLDIFLCSLGYFDDLFKFLLKKLEDSNIQANDSLFAESIDLNQIAGVFKCIKNLLKYSRGFRSMLMDSVEKLHSGALPLDEAVTPREMLYRMLVHLLVNRKEYDGRDTDMEIIKILEILVRGGILSGSVMNSVDLSRIVDVAKENRDDPAIVLGIAPVIKHSGNSAAIQDLCSILDSQCFYYHSFLEFIFSLTDRLQRKVMSNVLSSLENEDFGLMIVSEAITSMLLKRGSEGELPAFIDKSIKFIFEFFENQYVDLHEEERGREADRIACMSQGNEHHEALTLSSSTCVQEEAGRTSVRIYALKLSTAKELSSLLFRKVPIKFVETILEGSPCIPFLMSIDFREQLYISIMNLYSNNGTKVFKFLSTLNQVMSPQELMNVFNKSKGLLEKISSYRAGPDYAPLSFTLNFLLGLDLGESDEALVQSVILNSVYFLQKKLDLKTRNGEKDYEDEVVVLERLTEFKFQRTVLSAIPSLITAIITLVNSNSLGLKNVGINLLAKLSERGLEVKYWKKEFVEIFHTLDFFIYGLHKKSSLMRKVVVEDPSIISDLIVRLDSGFFVSQASDANNKTLVLKRISYIIFSAPYNYFSGFSLKLVEKIATLMNYPSSKVRKEVFLLSKMLILKISHDKLGNLYPILLYDAGIVVESPDFDDMMLLVEVLKLLDIVFLLNTPQFSETRTVFLGPRYRLPGEKADGGEERKSVLESLGGLLRAKYRKEIPSKVRRPIKKIPFLMPGKVDVDEILDFTSNGLLYYNWLDENCLEIDYEYLFNLILEELRESSE